MKPRGLAIVIGAKPPRGKAPDDDDDEEESGEAREAADLAFESLKDDDKDGFYEALKSFVKSCKSGEY